MDLGIYPRALMAHTLRPRPCAKDRERGAAHVLENMRMGKEPPSSFSAEPQDAPPSSLAFHIHECPLAALFSSMVALSSFPPAPGPSFTRCRIYRPLLNIYRLLPCRSPRRVPIPCSSFLEGHLSPQKRHAHMKPIFVPKPNPPSDLANSMSSFYIFPFLT